MGLVHINGKSYLDLTAGDPNFIMVLCRRCQETPIKVRKGYEKDSELTICGSCDQGF